MDKDLPYWIALSFFPKFGAKTFQKFLKNFSTMEDVFSATKIELRQIGLKEKTVDEFITKRKDIHPEEIITKLKEEQIDVITLKDEQYPSLLKELHDPPALLYYRGNFPQPTPHISIVGSRKHSHYGAQIAKELSSTLSKHGFTIVSGLALGIDAIAHQAALKANGRTIGILGSGVHPSYVYPAQNKQLGESIIQSAGALISEFPPYTSPKPFHFPYRNRIIAGLCQGTIIIEAAEKSGSLITARLALESNRDVFALPGPITSPISLGPNRLIRDGAIPITAVEDILEYYETSPYHAPATTIERPSFNNPLYQTIIDTLSHEPLSINDILLKTNNDSKEVLSALTILEMKGYIKDIGGKCYILSLT